MVEDPFNIYETSTLQRNHTPTLIPDLLYQEENRASEDIDVLDSMFGMATISKNVPSPSSVTKDSLYDALFQKSKVPANQGSGNPPTTRKVSPLINVDDDFSFLPKVEGFVRAAKNYHISCVVQYHCITAGQNVLEP